MEILKRHWLTIVITVCCTSLAVYAVVMGVIIFTTPTTTAAENTVSFTTTPAKDLKIKGNKNSKIYHLPGCGSYDQISEKNIVWFKTEEEAQAAGYRKARNC